jgi:putative ABC transport system substrate-binding protein
MKRRTFIAGLGSAVAWPVVARGQQSPRPVIGFVSVNSFDDWAAFASAFRDGLKEVGYIEGHNAEIEYRWAEGRTERVPVFVDEMVRRQVAVIFGTHDIALAAKVATTTIPVVFLTGSDPVKSSLVASFNRPGGNLTGVYFFSNDLVMKRLQLLHQLVPRAALIALLVNPNVTANDQVQDTLDASFPVIQKGGSLSAGWQARRSGRWWRAGSSRRCPWLDISAADRLRQKRP